MPPRQSGLVACVSADADEGRAGLFVVFRSPGPKFRSLTGRIASLGRGNLRHSSGKRQRLCNGPEVKRPRTQEILYSLGSKELRAFGVSCAYRIPGRFVQHGPRVEGCSDL